MACASTERPSVLIVDSIHTIRDQDSDALPGGTGQVRACTDALVSLAKDQGITILLIGHITKGGDLAGPRTLEHAVDVVLTFEGDPGSGLRILCGGKNRFGPEGEVAWFEMGADGLAETEPGPRIGQGEAEPGCATAIALAGRRAFAVDVQALVTAAEGPPRRQVTGLDPRRFHIVSAVTGRAMGSQLARGEIFDLAVAAALASAEARRALRARAGFIGELSLSGSVRPVPGTELRLSAGLAAGLRTVVLPAAGPRLETGSTRVELVRVDHLREALTWALGR